MATASAFAWGMVYATAEGVLDRMSPLATLAAFYWWGSLLLLPVALLPAGREALTGVVSNPGPFAVTLLAVVTAELLILWSISLLGGTEASLIEITYPLWTALIVYFMKGETLDKGTLVGGGFILLGVFILTRSQA